MQDISESQRGLAWVKSGRRASNVTLQMRRADVRLHVRPKQLRMHAGLLDRLMPSDQCLDDG